MNPDSSPTPASSSTTPPPSTPNGRWVVVLVLSMLAAAGIGAAFYYDRPVREALVSYQSAVAEEEGQKRWNRTSEHRMWGAISKYGDWPQLMLFGGAMLGLSVWRRRADWTRVIIAALLASTLAGILANVSRLTTGRVRPRAEATHGEGFHGPWHEGRFTIGVPDFNGFPSGHTATAIGFAGPFLLAKPLIGVPFFLMALAIAISRMQLGAHHVSDVVVSILLALAVSWFVLRWVRLHGTQTGTFLWAKIRRRGPP